MSSHISILPSQMRSLQQFPLRKSVQFKGETKHKRHNKKTVRSSRA